MLCQHKHWPPLLCSWWLHHLHFVCVLWECVCVQYFWHTPFPLSHHTHTHTHLYNTPSCVEGSCNESWQWMVDKAKRPDYLLPIDPQLSSAAASQQPQQASFPTSSESSLLSFVVLLDVILLFLLPLKPVQKPWMIWLTLTLAWIQKGEERRTASRTHCRTEMQPLWWINDEVRLLKHRAAQPARPLWKHQSGWTCREWALIYRLMSLSSQGRTTFS